MDFSKNILLEMIFENFSIYIKALLINLFLNRNN